MIWTPPPSQTLFNVPWQGRPVKQSGNVLSWVIDVGGEGRLEACLVLGNFWWFLMFGFKVLGLLEIVKLD